MAARITYVRDAQGRVLEEAFWDPAGKPRRNAKGCARVTWAFDAQGFATDTAYFDAAGKPLRVQVVLLRVEPGTQAARAGLQKGDVIVSFDGKPVGSVGRFAKLRRDVPPGTPPRELTLRRGDREIRVQIKSPDYLGVGLEDRIIN
jgi:S1-C subfamily serine protease